MYRRELLLETCEDRILCDGTPDVTLQAPANAKIGEQVKVTATFDNTAANAKGNTGFAPYIDLALKATGADGAGAAVDDGVTFVGATYLGAPVTATVLTFDASGKATHPYAKDAAGNPLVVDALAGFGPGDQLVVLRLPFGSFAPDQPPADVSITLQMSNLADVDKPLAISARGGFQYTNDGTDNPGNGASIIDPAYANTTVTPSLFTLKKVYLGPEDETATGPNFTRQYQIQLDVATGQTLTNVDLTDLLPAGMQFVSLDSVTGGGTVTDLATPSTTSPGGTLTRRIDSITGVDGVDAVMTFSVYVPQVDSTANPIIDPATGDDVTLENNASASGTWTPIDTRDPMITSTVDAPGPEHVLTAKSIATQKSVAIVKDTGAPGATPGDTLEYTVQIQVSDYFAFQNLSVNDLFSDGQRLDSTFTPTMTFQDNGSSGAVAGFAGSNYSATVDTGHPGATGSTTLLFNISGELMTRGDDGKLVGGLVNPLTGAILPPNGDGPTTVTIRYRTVIQDKFSNDFPSGGDPSLNPNDTLTNDVTVSGAVLNNGPLFLPTGQTEADTSHSTIAIQPSSVSKSVYAINGSTTLPPDLAVKPGDTVTYRIRYTIPTGDVENLVIADYLPAPFFLASQVVNFSGAAPSGTIPPAGTAKWGPLETLRLVSGAVPVPTVDAGSNAIFFTYPAAIDDPTNTTREVDILFTVTVGDIPAKDLLYVTNLVQATESGTNGPTTSTATDSIAGISVEEPAVATGGKGIVGYNNTGLTLGGITFTAPGTASTISGGPVINAAQATAIAGSNLLAGEVDAGDTVRYGLVLQNTGTSDAYDVRFNDQIINPGYNLPAGATDIDRLDAINLTLFRGDGTALVRGVDYLATLTTGGLLNIELVDNYTAGNVGENGSGGLSAGLAGTAGTPVTNGSNTVIATYDLTLASTQPGIANLGATITNTATLYNYASIEGGHDFSNPDPHDSASVKLPQPTLAKTLTGTEIADATNSNTQAVIGELATYTLTLTVPEGSVAAAQIKDTLDAGLAFVDVVGVTLSSGLSTSKTIGTGAAPANVTVGTGGQNLTFDFGTITNSNTDNAATETITIVYRAVVLDANTTTNNQAGTQLNNTASFTGQFTDLPTGTPQSYTTPTVSAANVTVIEPTLQVTKTVSSTSGGTFGSSLTNVDAGDTAFYKIVISNPSGPSAFELSLNDVIPSGMTGLSIFNVAATGYGSPPSTPGAGDFSLTGQTLGINNSGTLGGNIDVPAGATITILVQGSLTAAAQPDQSFTNNATIHWTSLDGNFSAPRSTYNSSSVERTGGTQTPAAGVNLATSDQSILDNYAATSGNAVITIANPVPVKTIDATSEPSTGVVGGVEQVTIGEIVRYRIVWQIPEGTSDNLVITDLLPGRMRFINDGTATLALVSTGGNMSSSIGAIGTAASVAGDETTLSGINASFVIPPGQFAGGDPVLNLGNVTNPDRDANQEFVVIEFNASVLNVATNQGVDNASGAAVTTNLTNSVRVQTATSDQTSADVPVHIVEPAITNVTKTASAGPYDAGDVVTYTVTYSNATGNNASTAFDVAMTDVLPAFLTNVTFLNATSTGAVTGLAGSAIGNMINVNADSMAPGATVTITYTGTLVSNIPAGQVVSNTARVTYTSLPGSGNALDDGLSATTNSTPGATGTQNGERNGTDGPAGALNDYADSSTVNLTVTAPTLDKTFQGGTLTADDTSVASSTGASVVIGEKVTYDIFVTLPEGVTPSLSITDLVPAGLRVDSINILTAGFSGAFAMTPTLGAPVSGGSLVLNFGDTTVPADNDGTNNSFVIRVQATVLNVVGNQAGTTLTNTATLSYNNNGTTATVIDRNPANDPTVTVVEPAIVTTKTVDNSTPDAGDVVKFTIVLNNTSSQTAYDVSLNDILPPGLLGAAIVSVSSTGAIFVNGAMGTPVANTDVIIAGGSTLQFADGSNIDIAAGATLTIVGSGTVTGSALPSNVVTNTANTRWTSTDGANLDERTGTDGIGGALNDYASSGSVTVMVPAAEFGKVLFSTSAPSTTGNNVTIGETVTYALVVNLPEGQVAGITVSDMLPVGLQYLSSSVVTTAAASGGLLTANFGGTLPNPTVVGGATDGAAVGFTFGQVTVTGDNNPANNRFLILVTARVLNEPSNVGVNPPGQTVLPNTAAFDVIGDAAAPIISAPVDVTVVEPKLVIAKNIVQATGDAGDTVTITLTVNNTGTSSAFDVIVNDPFPAGKFTGFAVGTTPAGFTFGATGNTVTFSGGTIAAGGSATFTFTAVLTSAVVPGEVINNTATVTQATTLPGAVTGERDEPDVSASDSIAVPVGSYQKTIFATSDPNTAGSNVGIGETVTYALKVTLPEGTTTNLTVIDLLPPGLQFVSQTLVTSAASSNGLLTANFAGTVPAPVRTGGTGDGDDQTFTFGTISVTGDNATDNDSFLILVTARVTDVVGNVGTTGGQTVLNNQASFDIPTDGQPPTITPNVPVTVVEPRLQITKSTPDHTPDPGQVLDYTLTISHTASSTEIAYDVLLRDAIPTGLALDTTSIMVNGVAVGASGIVDSNNSTGSLLDLKFNQLALGDTITITYQAQVTTSPTVAGANLDNTAKIYWDTDPAEDKNTICDGGTDGTPDRDLGAVAANEAFNANTDPAQDTERVVVNVSTISGTVYVDTQPNGVFDTPDTPIGGVLLTLTGTDLNGNAISQTTTTAADGTYTFIGLTPGTYRIDETQPIGYTDGVETVGTPFGGMKDNTSGSDFISGITIPAQNNGAGTGYNFGEAESSGLRGRVYIDTNANGMLDAADIGISGVVVTLSGLDAASLPVNLTTTTTAGGIYFFGDLRPGNYTLTETQPAGFLDGKDNFGTVGGVAGNDVISDIMLPDGVSASDYTFGEVRPSSLSGFVYNDANNDGAFAGTEAPIAGVPITLTGTDFQGHAVSQMTATDSNGFYQFTTLSPGTYAITETQPTGFLDGKDTPGTPGGSAATNDVIGAIMLGENFNGVNHNFGELTPSSIAGRVYVDANDDGVFETGETPLNGVPITLSGTDDLGASVSVTTSTDLTGGYGFTTLRPGTYTLTETQPGGYFDGQETIGTGTTGGVVDNTTDSQTISTLMLPSGTDSTGNNFGELLPASLSGKVYRDLNNNGAIDSGETGVQGVIVTLTGTDDRGNTVNTPIPTNGTGDYLFDNLRPGTYTITETQPAALLDGKETIGTPGGATGQDTFTTIQLTSGTMGANNNFGELPPASLGGSVYIDSNNDGVLDGGEQPLVGETVTLTGTDDLGATVSTTTMTNGTGGYLFDTLRPGTYTITETQPAGYLDGKDTQGTPGGGTAVNDAFQDIPLTAGTLGAGNNFGELRPSSISGRVGVDTNNDFLDPGDPGLLAARVTLTGLDDLGNAVNISTITNFLGAYSFENLRPGVYNVTEPQPPQYLDGKDLLGTVSGRLGAQPGTLQDSRGSGLDDRVSNILLVENTTDTGNNFGELEPSRIIGSVFVDKNNDGIRDPKEPGIANATVKLNGIDDLGHVVSRTTTTDGLGIFSFGFLRPGLYEVIETQPRAYADGKDTPGTTGGTTNGALVGNDHIFGILLAPGGASTDNFFGERLIPPTPPTPVQPTNPEPEKPEGKPPFIFAYDSFHNFSLVPDHSLIDGRLGSINPWRDAVLPLAPIYSGSANPGATLTLDLYSANGIRVGTTTVTADAGGNWLANFGNAALKDTPATVRVTQTDAPFGFGSSAGHNLRVYYAPSALNPGQYVTQPVEENLPDGDAPLLGGLGLSHPLRLGPQKYGGEFLPSGGVPTGQ